MCFFICIHWFKCVHRIIQTYHLYQTNMYIYIFPHNTLRTLLFWNASHLIRQNAMAQKTLAFSMFLHLLCGPKQHIYPYVSYVLVDLCRLQFEAENRVNFMDKFAEGQLDQHWLILLVLWRVGWWLKCHVAGAGGWLWTEIMKSCNATNSPQKQGIFTGNHATGQIITICLYQAIPAARKRVDCWVFQLVVYYHESLRNGFLISCQNTPKELLNQMCYIWKRRSTKPRSDDKSILQKDGSR